MKFIVHSYTTKYYKKPINEDGVFINEIVISDGYFHSTYELDSFNACVCDGVTGADKGFYASQFILQSIANDESNNFEEYKKALIDINYNLIEEGVCIKAKDMSSTIAGVYFEEGNANIYNVGDSRVYKISEEGIKCMTEDDAVAFRLFRDGVISEKDIKTHPQRNVLVNYFGNNNDFVVNSRIDRDIKNAKYIICSDGLSDFLDAQKTHAIVNSNDDGFNMMRMLVGEALKFGCNDDISIIFIEVRK